MFRFTYVFLRRPRRLFSRNRRQVLARLNASVAKGNKKSRVRSFGVLYFYPELNSGPFARFIR